MGQEECNRITKGLDKNGKPDKKKWEKVAMRKEELKKNGMNGERVAFTDTQNSPLWGGIHRGHLGCIVCHEGTIYAWVPKAPKSYGFPRFLTACEAARAMGHFELVHVAQDKNVPHKLLCTVTGQSISAWAADVVGETLEVAFPSVFNHR